MNIPERLRWKLWSLVTHLPRVCQSNAHTAVVLTHPDRNRNPFIDGACRRDLAATGSCWCMKLHEADLKAGL